MLHEQQFNVPEMRNNNQQQMLPSPNSSSSAANNNNINSNVSNGEA
jgi:hypothetical protein